MRNQQNYKNLFKVVSIFIVIFGTISILLLFFSKDTAGYRYIPYTALQMEIANHESDWGNRIILKNKNEIKLIISLVSNSSLNSNFETHCDAQKNNSETKNQVIDVLIRRNFIANNDLAWRICADKSNTYLIPTLNGTGMREEYKTGKTLMEELEQIFEENNSPPSKSLK